MNLKNFRDGLEILQRYYQNPDGHHLSALHDQIILSPTETPLDDVDVRRMIECHWHQEHDERDYSEDFALADYRADECWIAYT